MGDEVGAGAPGLPWTRALVVGAGASGCATTRLLVASGLEVRVYDRRPSVDGLPAAIVPHLGVEFPPPEAYDDIDLLVLSPGIDPRPFRAQQQRRAPDAEVHGEMSLALDCVHREWPRVPAVLITGTNGKSTVTAMIGDLLEAGGMSPFVGGNFGTPLCDVVLAVAENRRTRPGALVLECSSYQLETWRGVPTDVAMVLNVSPDHLARYASMDEYAATKSHVFDGLVAGGLAMVLAGDPYTETLRGAVPASATTRLVGGHTAPRLDGDELVFADQSRFARSRLPVHGRHNALNALFAGDAAAALGVGAATIEATLSEFGGLPHRMVAVDEVAGITYYDDSKATNVASVAASLGGFDRPFVLIAGGQAKGDDPTPIAELLAAGGRGLVAIGEAAELFLALAPDGMPHVAASTMDEAVRAATAMASPGDAVVLSPACASWDMYESYAHRGRVFAEAVATLKNSGRPGAA